MTLPATYLRYIAVSAVALGVDVALFLGAIALGAPAALAAAGGYIVGIAAHWALSSRAVFGAQLAAPGVRRRQQQALFIGSALVGLALTTGIVGIAEAAGLDPRLAKLAAIAISFQTTYLLRRRIVFAC